MQSCRLGIALFAIALAAPAAAQSGAMWVDDLGRMMSMQFAGGSGAPPAPADRSPETMASIFKKICVDAQGDPTRLGSDTDLQALALVAEPLVVPGPKKGPAPELNVLRGNGIVVSQTPGFFAAKQAQCNVTFYVRSLPSRDAVAAALASTLGTPPTNASEAFKKNGKPNVHYAPEWTMAIDGVPQIVVSHVGKGSQYMPGDRVQIAMRALRKAKQ